MSARYLIALGSNVRHLRHGPPRQVLRAALGALGRERGIELEAASRIVTSAPLGPSRRRYANAAAIVRASLSPPELLARLKAIEVRFARRRGRRWGARTLDLDIVLWSEGPWASPGLIVPHVAFRERAFVLTPALAIARTWRDPVTSQTIAHLAARLRGPRPLATPG